MNLKWLPALALATQLHADVIDIGPNGLTKERVVNYSELNNISLTGQPLSFDVMFNNSVHLFSNDFEVGLWLQLATSEFVHGTGYLLDLGGNSISTCAFASARSDTGIAAFGLFPDQLAPFSFYGAHFDLTMPEDNSVLSGRLFLSGRTFRVGPHIPDGGSTVTLFILGLVCLIFYDQKTAC